ncbi:unnamed protein product [Sympodiomycopsis kandeliae]
MAVPEPPVDGVAARSQQPAWTVPQPIEPEPQLKVYNSLTRTKVPFVPLHGKHVTWYNCGPTVYDASHMGHARNYVTQDILRRILAHLGYSSHFVMNITDIDDKIILRARQNHLVDTFRSQHPVITSPLVHQVRESWAAFFKKTIKKFAPPPPSGESIDEIPDEAAWEEISRLNSQETWRSQTTQSEPKFSMWFTALDKSRQAIIAATMTVAANGTSDPSSSSSPPTQSSQELIDASIDILASSLDKQHGHTVTDPSIYRALAAKWETSFFDDMKRLNVLPPHQLTRVSEYVPEIVTFIDKIIKNGFAYADSKGNVWFDVHKFDGSKTQEGQDAEHSYAKLAPWSKGNKELLEEGEGSLSTGATTTEGKKSSADFALWKSSKPGEPSWQSIWGPGRPGWHIECSVMASEVLGTRIDVHSGGVDLMFPHHDNELAQSEAHHGCAPWINYFLHTGHLHIEGLKMSKSLKNFISIDEALERFSGRQLRLAFLLQTWSSRMDFSESAMSEVHNAEKQISKFFVTVKTQVRSATSRGSSWSDGQHHYGSAEKELVKTLTQAQLDFRKALCDSFDTPTAMRVVLDLISATNVYERERRQDPNVRVLQNIAGWVGEMLRMFGLGEGAVREGDIGWGEREGVDGESSSSSADRETLLIPYLEALSSFRSSVRSLARSGAPHSELLKLADRLRDEDLVDLGVALEDNADGTAMVKLVPAEQLRAERAEKERLEQEKQKRKAANAARESALKAEKLRKSKIPPHLLFKPVSQGGLVEDEKEFSAWDEKGIPTIDGKTGAEVSKKKRKGYEKEYATQERVYKEYLEAKERGEVE